MLKLNLKLDLASNSNLEPRTVNLELRTLFLNLDLNLDLTRQSAVRLARASLVF